MTGHLPLLLNRQQQHIGIAVVAQAAQLLEMAAGGSLVPQLLAGAAPVVHLTAVQRALQGLAIHPGHHQHRPIEPVLGHGRDQSSLIPAQALDPGWASRLEAARAITHGIAGHWVERY